jgi:hypothetical protein
MREKNGLYEYIAVYLDDLMIAARDPALITKTLSEQHKFEMKEVSPLSYQDLGCEYLKDDDGTLCYGPKMYISKIIGQYENKFGVKPREYMSSLEKGDPPEIDQTEDLDTNGIKKYQTMIGCLLLAVSLGRFDIQTATITISRFRVAPKKIHLGRLKRMFSSLFQPFA